MTVEIPGHTGEASTGPKPKQGNNPQDCYAPGAEPSSAQGESFWQQNLYLVLFCVGWLLFPCWWAGALLGLKAGKQGRERLSRQEKTAWQACVVLSAIGLILFLIFIIWYGADPENAKRTLVAGYNKLTGNDADKQVQPAEKVQHHKPRSRVLSLTPAQDMLQAAACSACTDMWCQT